MNFIGIQWKEYFLPLLRPLLFPTDIFIEKFNLNLTISYALMKESCILCILIFKVD